MKYNGLFKKGKIVSLINKKDYNFDNNNLVNINHRNNCDFKNIFHGNSDNNINKNKEKIYKIIIEKL